MRCVCRLYLHLSLAGGDAGGDGERAAGGIDREVGAGVADFGKADNAAAGFGLRPHRDANRVGQHGEARGDRQRHIVDRIDAQDKLGFFGAAVRCQRGDFCRCYCVYRVGQGDNVCRRFVVERDEGDLRRRLRQAVGHRGAGRRCGGDRHQRNIARGAVDGDREGRRGEFQTGEDDGDRHGQSRRQGEGGARIINRQNLHGESARRVVDNLHSDFAAASV